MAGFGPTLRRYFAVRFVLSITSVFLTVFALVYALDFVELMRRAGDATNATPAMMARLALYRTPGVAEQVLPFAVLFGSMLTFLTLSRRLELVVARSAGVSVWGLLTPALAAALVLGILTSTVYNPISAHLRQRASEIESRLFVRASRNLDNDLFIRQRSGEGAGIIRAGASAEAGRVLLDVTFFLFDPAGVFRERVEAKQATLGDGRWKLTAARVVRVGAPPLQSETYEIATNLRPELIRQTVTAPQNVPFWQLPGEVRNSQEAGIDATRYRLQFQSLLALPLLFVAMVIIASTVSLRFFRMGGISRMVLGGVAAGFMLYVVKKLVEDLGSSGLLSVEVAAWSTAVAGCLFGCLVLLHLEDG